MTVHLVVLGSPVAHSLSPRIHAAAMAALAIDGTYTARDVDEGGVRVAADEARGGTLLGANITMPHKRLAAALADGRTATVEVLGTANTWWVAEGRLWADATDGDGVRFAWDRAGLSRAAPVRILGAGGAAAAAALELASTHDVRVSARDPGRARAVAERVGCGTVPWGDACAGETVVNATPIGMGGEEQPAWVTSGVVGYLEMVYAGGATPAARLLRAEGVPIATGLDMLVGQGARAFERWFGVAPPVEVMLAAAKPSSAP